MTPRPWSISALAVELGRDRRTVAAACAALTPLTHEQGQPRFRLADVVAALQAPPPPPPDAEEARARKLAAEARIAELQLGRLEGSLVPVDSVAQAVASEYGAVRAKLLGVPAKAAPLLMLERTEAGMARAVRDAIADALQELSDDATAALRGADADATGTPA